MSGYLGTMTATGGGFDFVVYGSKGYVRFEGMTHVAGAPSEERRTRLFGTLHLQAGAGAGEDVGGRAARPHEGHARGVRARGRGQGEVPDPRRGDGARRSGDGGDRSLRRDARAGKSAQGLGQRGRIYFARDQSPMRVSGGDLDARRASSVIGLSRARGGRACRGAARQSRRGAQNDADHDAEARGRLPRAVRRRRQHPRVDRRERRADRRRSVPADGAEVQGHDRRARRRRRQLRDQHALALRSRRRQSSARPRRHVARRARDLAADDDEEQRHQSRIAEARSAGLRRDGVAGADLRRHDALSLQRRAHRSHALRSRRTRRATRPSSSAATRPCTWATCTTTPAIRSSTPTTAAA